MGMLLREMLLKALVYMLREKLEMLVWLMLVWMLTLDFSTDLGSVGSFRSTEQVVSALSSGSRPGYLRNANTIPFAISLPHRTYSRFVKKL